VQDFREANRAGDVAERPSEASQVSSHYYQEDVMAGTKEPVRIKLTPDQQEIVRKATGKNAEALELTAEELEERIAPGFKFGG